MKKYIAVFALTVLAAGCGGRPSGNQAAGTQKQGSSGSQTFLQEGFSYLKENDYQKAIKSFDQAIKKEPKNIDNYMTLGQVYLRLKNYPSAVDTLSAAVQVSPQSGEAYYLLATSKALKGDVSSAIIDAQKSAQLFIQRKDQEKLKKTLVLLKGLSEGQSPAVKKE